MLRFGYIKEINNEKARAKVYLPSVGKTSDWLVILQKGSGAVKEKDLPSLNEKVACLFDENMEDGCILGSYYSDSDVVPSEPDSIVKEALNAFKTVIDKITGVLTWSFKKITFSAEEINLNTQVLNINGVNFIELFNNHPHGNGNDGADTTAPKQEIPTE